LSENISYFKRELKSNPLALYGGTMMLGPVFVGTPPVEFQVIFDTGSNFFFLAGDGCRVLPGHNQYDQWKSSTAVSLGKAFYTSFIGGSAVFGFQYTDTVTIAISLSQDRISASLSSGLETTKKSRRTVLWECFSRASPSTIPVHSSEPS
jgi:Eukaryotic aspartyl protease